MGKKTRFLRGRKCEKTGRKRRRVSIRVGKGSKEVKATMLSGHWPSTHCREATWEALKCTP